MPWELPITIEDTTYPVRFNTEAEPSQADIDEAVAYITQQRSAPAQKSGPPDSGQGRASSFASSVGRGAASIVPGVIGGVGYLTGSEGLVEAADTIEAGINRALPVNPAYEDEFLMKAGQALGQVVPMIGTGGAAGAVGKSMALARGLEAGAAAAKGTQLAGRVMLGSGMLQGTRGGGQAAEQYGMEGGAAYARALLGGAIEGATEKYLFGMGSELSPIGRMLGSGATPGATILRAAGTEGVEEGVAEIGGNLATTALAPSGTQTPGLFANAGEATALGAIAGGALGGFNAALGGGEKPTVEGVAVVQPPAPIQEEERLAPEVESAVERAIATIQPPTAVSPVATLEQQANETMDAFLGRLNAQQEQLAKDLKAFAVETVKVNADVLPATAAASASGAPALAPALAPTPATGDPADIHRKRNADNDAFYVRDSEGFTDRKATQELRDAAAKAAGMTRDAWEDEQAALNVKAKEDFFAALNEGDTLEWVDGNGRSGTGVVEIGLDGKKGVRDTTEGSPAEGYIYGPQTGMFGQVADNLKVTKPAPTVDLVQTARDRLKQAAAAPPTTPTQETPAVAPEAMPEEPVVDDLSRIPPPSEQPEPEPPVVEETVPPIEPIPAVEEAIAPQDPNAFNEEAAALNDLQIAEDDYRAAEQKAKQAEDLFFAERDKYDTRKNKPRNYTYAGPKEQQERILALASYAYEMQRYRNNVAQDLGKARKNASSVAPTPPITEDKFPQTENVVAPAGDTEVGLGMDKLNTAFDTLFQLPAKQPRTLSAMRDRVIAKLDEMESTPELPIYGNLPAEEKDRNFKKNERRQEQIWQLEGILEKIETERLSQSKGNAPKAAKKPYVGPSWSEGRPTVAEAKAYLIEQLGPEPTTAEQFKDKTLDVDGWWRAIASEERNGTPRGRALVNAAIEWKQLKADEARQEAILAEEKAKEEAPPPQAQPVAEKPAAETPGKKMTSEETEAPAAYNMEQARRQWIDEERTRNPSFAPDVQSWLELQTPEDQAAYQEFEELRYKNVASQGAEKGYKPYTLSAKEKARLQELANKFLPRLAAEVTDTREAPAPPTPEDQFQKTENVVAPAGETEVGLGMEPLPKGTEIEFDGEELRVVGYEGDGRMVVSSYGGAWKNLPAGTQIKVLPAVPNPYASLVSAVEEGFDFLDRLQVRKAPESAEVIPSGRLPRGTRYFRSDFKSTGASSPPSYAITPDGMLYEDSNRGMTHGGVSPYVLRGQIEAPPPQAQPVAEKPAAETSGKMVTPEQVQTKIEELLRAPTKATKKPAVSFKTQTEETAFKQGFVAATKKPGESPPPEKMGLSPKDRKWDDAWRKGWASGQTFVRSLPETLPIASLVPIPEDMARAKQDKAENNERWQKASVSREPINVLERLDGTLQVTDGHHRLLAAKDRGETDIPVVVTKETKLEPLKRAAPAKVEQPAPQRDTSKPEQMTPEELTSFQKEEAIRAAQEYLDRAKSGKDAPNVFTNGFKSKAAMVRAKEADLETAKATTPKPDVWGVVMGAANSQRPIYTGLVNSLSDVDQVFGVGPAGEPGGTAPSPRKQLIENLVNKGYVAEGELYVYRPDGGVKVEEAQMSDEEVEAIRDVIALRKKRGQDTQELEAKIAKAKPASRPEFIEIDPDTPYHPFNSEQPLLPIKVSVSKAGLATLTSSTKSLEAEAKKLKTKLRTASVANRPLIEADIYAVEKALKELGRVGRELDSYLKSEPKVTTKLVTEEKAAELKKSIKRKIGGQTNMLLDPTLFADAVVLGTYYVEKGARTFAAFSEKMIDDIGESIRENLEDIYNAVREKHNFEGVDRENDEKTESTTNNSNTLPAESGEVVGVPASRSSSAGTKPSGTAPSAVQTPNRAESPPPPAKPVAPTARPSPLEGPVSIVNEQLNQVAEIIGLPQIETPLDGPYKWEAAWEDARVEMEQNPNRGSELVSEMIARPREVSPVEVPILLREAVIRTNAYNAAVEAQTKATAGGQEAANQRVSDAINALADVQQASALMGTISGRALNFRKMSAWMDFSLANMVLRLKGAKQADLSKEEMKDAQDTSKKIADTEKKIEDTKASAGAEAELTSIFDETFKEALALTKKNANDLIAQSRIAAKQGKTMKAFLLEKREEARKRIRLRGNNLNMGLNPADLFDHAVIMASYIAEGVVSLADLTAKMVGDFGQGVEKHIPQIKAEADALMEAEQQVFEKPEEGTTKTYAEQLVESQGEALSDRWVYNRVKEWLVEQGEAGLKRDSKELLDEVFKVITKEVNEFDPSITEQQLRDMFSGYGKVKFPNPEAAAVKLRQMRRLELLFDKLERARAGVAPLRAGLQRDETTPEEREALRLLNQTMKDLDIPQAPSGRNIKTPLDAVKSRLKNSIEDLNKQIKDVKEGRGRTVRSRKDVDYDPEAKALEADRDALQKQLDEIDPVKEPTVEERVKARLKDLDKQITDLQERLGKKDFAPSQNKTPITQEIQVKVDARDALSRTLKELRAETEIVPSLSQDQINELAQLSLGRQIKALEQQIKDQDVAPKTTQKAEATPMLYRLQARLEALRKERDDLKKSLGFGKKPKTDDELIDAAVASLEKTIDKLNKQISENDLTSKTRPSKTPEVAKIKNLRAERDSLREEVQRLRKAKEDAAKDPIAEKLKKDRKQLQRMIQGYEDKIKKGDFRKRPKIAKAYDDSLMQLEIDLDNLKAAWSKKVFEAHLASRPPLKRMLDTGGQILNTSRAILTSMDLSAVLRQGGFIGLGNPIRAARNITPMLRAFTSDDVAKASLKRLKQRSNWKNYTLAGLYIAETDQTKMSAQEEAFMSRWVDKIPGGAKGLFIGSLVRGSQRAYLTFLNNLRADTFDSLLNQLQKGPTPTREEMESIASYINIATGRGDLGKGAFNQAAVGLNTIFFAPRLVASRFQIIGGMPIFKATGRTKALVLQEYAKFIMGATIVYALAGMAQDDDDEPLEFDPRSSDFLKVRFGNTRVDPLGGLIQATVFTSRVLSGETKSAKGKITPIRDTLRPANLFRDVPRTDKVPYGGRNVFNVGADFMRTKFSPAFGGFVDLTVGENVIGEAVTPLDIAYKMTVPMSFDEARETIEAHGMPKGPALTALMLFGAGVMTYDERKK